MLMYTRKHSNHSVSTLLKKLQYFLNLESRMKIYNNFLRVIQDSENNSFSLQTSRKKWFCDLKNIYEKKMYFSATLFRETFPVAFKVY